MKLYLQTRWQLERNYLVYYGMRKTPYTLRNKIELKTKELIEIQKLLNGENVDKNILNKFITQEIIVPEEKLNIIPKSFQEARFCENCVANDFMIPGIEFDDNGLCPMCASKEKTKNYKSVVPMMTTFPKAKKSRFDVAVFYTGGKDSSFLLYYLAKKLNLRVLALTWEIPFMSDSARLSIENAKKKLKNVEFVSRKVDDNSLLKIYKKLYELNGNTCACPSLAYILFYPLLVSEKVPYFVLGNEPVQIQNLYFNNMAPSISYTFSSNKFLNFLLNFTRVLTLRKPFKPGQFHTLAVMKQLAYGDVWIKKLSNYQNTFLNNIMEAIKEVKSITKPLKRAIRVSSFTGNIPAFIHIDFNEISEGGVYNWENVKKLITEEVGWVGPSEENKGLHTSCKIEKCKEYSQFIAFYKMKSTMIPFSAIELSLATRDKNINREKAILEINHSLGFSLEEPLECNIMKEYLNK